jgi:hypothetical protein
VDDRVSRIQREGRGPRSAIQMDQDSEPAPKTKDKKEPRTIDFSVILLRPDGTPQKETPTPSFAQISQLAASSDFAEFRSKLQDMAQAKDMTLAKACDIALDVGIDADKNEGLKPKMRRGDLMKAIWRSVNAEKELTLPSEDITLIKNRIASVFTQAYIVYEACSYLDPAIIKEDD